MSIHPVPLDTAAIVQCSLRYSLLLMGIVVKNDPRCSPGEVVHAENMNVPSLVNPTLSAPKKQRPLSVIVLLVDSTLASFNTLSIHSPTPFVKVTNVLLTMLIAPL